MPVFLMIVQEAHKEYNSLTDQIRAKYEQLDSGEYGSVDTSSFKAEACELQIYLLMWANFARNWTCWLQRNYTGPHSSSIEEHLSDLNSYTRQAVWLGYGGCSFVPIDM